MADDRPSSFWLHDPMPYRVVLRVSLAQDGPPQRFEKNVVAYSVAEAVIQAAMLVGAEQSLYVGEQAQAAKYVVEEVNADYLEYLRMRLMRPPS